MLIILPDRSTHTIDGSNIPLDEILKRFGINPIEVIITVNGRVVPEDAVAGEGDHIRVLQIAHGG
jgi:sulfur carrier protein ThiS